jgi:hypothetical protein
MQPFRDRRGRGGISDGDAPEGVDMVMGQYQLRFKLIRFAGIIVFPVLMMCHCRRRGVKVVWRGGVVP